jgi:hypothetical protein
MTHAEEHKAYKHPPVDDAGILKNRPAAKFFRIHKPKARPAQARQLMQQFANLILSSLFFLWRQRMALSAERIPISGFAFLVFSSSATI